MKNIAYFKVDLQVRMALGSDTVEGVDPRLFTLLSGIAEAGSLRAAADRTGCSYRHAWGLLDTWKTILGYPLADLERGRGARLTPLGEALLAVRERVDKKLRPALSRLSREAATVLMGALPRQPSPEITIAASHSFAMETLRDMAASASTPFDLHTCGSVEALRRLHAGDCDMAGFHLPWGRSGRRLAHHYRRWLDPRVHRLFRVATRVQGLMTAPENPKNIHDLDDLCRPGVRFINRQPDSGTRLLLDDLTARNGIDTTRIDGYTTCEFTHMAVAAMVAGNVADAGFGIAAAAERFGLLFQPMAREGYLLAVPNEHPERAALSHVITLLGQTAFQEKLGAMAGYDMARSGHEVSVTEALSGHL